MNPLQLFNPSNQSVNELIDNFSIRLKEYTRIKTAIEKDKMFHPPQHYIIQGVRGSGKTTLLWRLYYEQKKSGIKSIIPIIFNEEQYGLNKLFKLWEQIAKELGSESSVYNGLLDEIQDSEEIETYEEHSYKHLFNALSKNKNKICLFWDNIDEILQKLTKKEQQRLREILITNNQIRIIGASSEVLESSYKYDEPFYEYFKIIHLKELNKEETIKFLLALDKINNTNKIDQIIKESPGKIEALRVITGGIPRTIVLLYEIFINDEHGDSFKYLETLLDRVTPLYKHRMDHLSSQQQEIVDCIALNWDAIGVKEIAKKTRMESKSISAQLRLLEKNNVITKKPTSTKNHFYQVKERFFNIWYIMRNGHKSDKNKVKWLIRFLELWCDKTSLSDMINTHISKLQSGKIYDKYAYNLSEAFAQLVNSHELQHKLINQTKLYLGETGSSLNSVVSESDYDFLIKKINPLITERKFNEAISLLKRKKSNTGKIESHIAMIFANYLEEYGHAEVYYLEAIKKNDDIAMNNLAVIYSTQLNNPNLAEEYFKKAIKKGNNDAPYNLALFYSKQDDFKSAEHYYLLAAENEHSPAMNNLAFLYKDDLKNYKKAEKYFLLAINKGFEKANLNLAVFYDYNIDDPIKAEKYYKKAINLGDWDAMTYLGVLYENKNQNFDLAKEYYQMASKKGSVVGMNNLANLYSNKFEDYEKAEKYYLEASKGGLHEAFGNLGILYQVKYNNNDKAEEYYKLGTSMNDEVAMNNLGYLYFNKVQNKKEAEKLVSKAFSLNNGYDYKHTFSLILLWNNKIDEALQLIEKIFHENYILDKPQGDFQQLLNLLIAKGQHQFVLKLFKENKNNLKDRLKPVYFALMHFMKDEYPDEIKKMGEELNETVTSIIEHINDLKEKYK